MTTVPIIDTKICSGCGRCVAACLKRAITLESVNFHKTAELSHPEKCTACGTCLQACPIDALHW